MGLIKALSADGNPSFATITKVLDALGYRIDIVPKAKRAAADETDFDHTVQDRPSIEPVEAAPR